MDIIENNAARDNWHPCMRWKKQTHRVFELAIAFNMRRVVYEYLDLYHAVTLSAYVSVHSSSLLYVRTANRMRTSRTVCLTEMLMVEL